VGMKDVSHAVPVVCRLGWLTELMGSIPTNTKTFSMSAASRSTDSGNSVTSTYIEIRSTMS